jgi:hypothetical protein
VFLSQLTHPDDDGLDSRPVDYFLAPGFQARRLADKPTALTDQLQDLFVQPVDIVPDFLKIVAACHHI